MFFDLSNSIIMELQKLGYEDFKEDEKFEKLIESCFTGFSDFLSYDDYSYDIIYFANDYKLNSFILSECIDSIVKFVKQYISLEDNHIIKIKIINYKVYIKIIDNDDLLVKYNLF